MLHCYLSCVSQTTKFSLSNLISWYFVTTFVINYLVNRKPVTPHLIELEEFSSTFENNKISLFPQKCICFASFLFFHFFPPPLCFSRYKKAKKFTVSRSNKKFQQFFFYFRENKISLFTQKCIYIYFYYFFLT